MRAFADLPPLRSWAAGSAALRRASPLLLLTPCIRLGGPRAREKTFSGAAAPAALPAAGMPAAAAVEDDDGSGDLCFVTRRNFPRALQAFKAAVADEHARLVAMDLEFTGLHAPGAREELLDDLPGRVRKLRAAAQKFQVLQVGLAVFCQPSQALQGRGGGGEEAPLTLEAHTFTFNVAPPAGGFAAPDRVFQSQASSLAFLASCGFDFNAVLRDGVPYLSLAAHARAKAQLTEAAGAAAEPWPPAPLPANLSAADRAYLEGVAHRVSSWLEEEAPAEELPPGGAGVSLLLPPVNSYLRMLTYRLLESGRFSVPIVVEKVIQDAPGRVALRLTRVTDAAAVAAAAAAARVKQVEANAALLEAQFGFGEVVGALAASGLPLVGHNLLRDLAHFEAEFWGRPPPAAEAGGIGAGDDPLQELKASAPPTLPRPLLFCPAAARCPSPPLPPSHPGDAGPLCARGRL